VIYTVLCGYLLGWVLTSIGLALTIPKLNDPVRPQPHPIRLAAAAGLAWPLVILGAAEMVAVAIFVDAARRRRSASTQFDELPVRSDYPSSGPSSVGRSFQPAAPTTSNHVTAGVEGYSS
jgi:hypothetical protein